MTERRKDLVFDPIPIDQAMAKDLVLEYRRRIGGRIGGGGGSEIARQIGKNTDFELDRKMIENWMRNSDGEMLPSNFNIILAFMRTAHFCKLVPRARDIFEPQTRLARIGMAFFEVYGMPNADRSELEKRCASIAGYWVWVRSSFQDGDGSRLYAIITPVAGCPFATIHVVTYPEIQPVSGILFPMFEEKHFSARAWSRTNYREGALRVNHWISYEIVVTYPLEILPDHHRDIIGMENGKRFSFQRWKRNEIDPATIKMFDSWNLDVIPHGISEKKTQTLA